MVRSGRAGGRLFVLDYGDCLLIGGQDRWRETALLGGILLVPRRL